MYKVYKRIYSVWCVYGYSMRVIQGDEDGTTGDNIILFDYTTGVPVMLAYLNIIYIYAHIIV